MYSSITGVIRLFISRNTMHLGNENFVLNCCLSGPVLGYRLLPITHVMEYICSYYRIKICHYKLQMTNFPSQLCSNYCQNGTSVQPLKHTIYIYIFLFTENK